MATAARAGYLQEYPSLTQNTIDQFITVEDVTKMGHMCKIAAGLQSTTRVSNRKRTPKEQHALKQEEASMEDTEIPIQEPNNKKKLMFMTVTTGS